MAGRLREVYESANAVEGTRRSHSRLGLVSCLLCYFLLSAFLRSASHLTGATVGAARADPSWYTRAAPRTATVPAGPLSPPAPASSSAPPHPASSPGNGGGDRSTRILSSRSACT